MIDKLFVEEIIKNTFGDIVEIGGGHGESTNIFLDIASRYNRRVLVIDPFESGGEMPAGYGGYKLIDFMKNLQSDKNPLLIHLAKSNEPSCVGVLSSLNQIAFAYIDGLQFKENVLSDMILMSDFEVPVICVDDIDRNDDVSQVPLSLKEFLSISKYELIHQPDKRRAYLKRKNE